MSDIQFYVDVLRSTECQCEAKSKKYKTAFCFSCYSKLPKHIKIGLWKKIGNGFEGAYDEAVRYLNED